MAQVDAGLSAGAGGVSTARAVSEYPQQVLSYHDFINSDLYTGTGYAEEDALGWFSNLLFGSQNKAKDAYEAYLTNIENENAYRSTQSARAWEQEMSDTAVQRNVADMEKAGINPYLIYSSGASGASVPSVSASNFSSTSGRSSRQASSDSGRNLALWLMATARLIGSIGSVTVNKKRSKNNDKN